MSSYSVAIRGILGEFFSRRLWVVLTIFCLVAYPIGKSLHSADNDAAASADFRTALVVIVIATTTAFSNAAIWARDPRLQGLLAWPIDRRVLARATIVVGTMMYVLEFAIPQTIALVVAGITIQDLVVLLILGIACHAACWSFPTLRSSSGWVQLFVCGAGLATITWLSGILVTACVSVIAAAILFVASATPPKLSTKPVRGVGKFHSYPLVTVVSDQRIWVNAAAGLLFAAGFLFFSTHQPLALPIALSIPVTASVLTTMLSREPDTVTSVRMLGVERKYQFQYFAVLTGYFFFMMLIIAAIAMGLQTWRMSMLPLLIVIPPVVALVYLIMEVKFPLSHLKTEKEILKQPRRLLVTLGAALLCITWGMFLP